MGKADTTTQKFKRKSKISETQNSEEAPSIQHDATLSFRPLPEAQSNDNENIQSTEHVRLRKSSLSSSEVLEASISFKRPQSLTEARLDAKLPDYRLSPSSLFADNNIEVFQPSQVIPSVVASKASLIPSLSEELANNPHSEAVELCSCDTLAVNLCKVWTDDCLLLVLFVANRSSSALKNVNLVFENSEHFKVRKLSLV